MTNSRLPTAFSALVAAFAFVGVLVGPASVHAAQHTDRDQAAEEQAKLQQKADCKEPEQPETFGMPMMDEPFNLKVTGSRDCPTGPKKKQK